MAELLVSPLSSVPSISSSSSSAVRSTPPLPSYARCPARRSSNPPPTSLRSSLVPLPLPVRRKAHRARAAPPSSSPSPRCAASDASQLKSAREDLKELLRTTYAHPILVRLGWHDAGTYDRNIDEFPKRGGANGSLRFDIELKHAANAGLVNALKLVQPINDKYPGITYADLFQLASATAIEEAGGPKIPMRYGRVDVHWT